MNSFKEKFIIYFIIKIFALYKNEQVIQNK